MQFKICVINDKEYGANPDKKLITERLKQRVKGEHQLSEFIFQDYEVEKILKPDYKDK